MPRGPRLDAPSVLHHVMVRGLDRCTIFRDEHDRADFVGRLAGLAGPGAIAVQAWALLPNHAHLLVRTGARPLPHVMRSLLTGYAGAFNRRHKRTGHLFQNRYKSVVVEEEPYFLELVRYVHLNPLRARIVPDLRKLARYPWTGHAALMGRREAPWQDTRSVLRRFAPRPATARERYAAFVADGLARGRRPELQGGGLVRSAGGWRAVQALRRGRERWASDERILGSGEFVEAVLRDAVSGPPRIRTARVDDLPALVARCAAAWAVTPQEICSSSRRRAAAKARAAVSWLAVHELGVPMIQAARHLGISPTAVREGSARGAPLVKAQGLAGRRT